VQEYDGSTETYYKTKNPSTTSSKSIPKNQHPHRFWTVPKYVINFINRYLLYLKNPKIEKTSNKLDNYYRNTDPEIIKTRYKTRNGILSYLYYQMIDWTDKKEKDGLSL